MNPEEVSESRDAKKRRIFTRRNFLIGTGGLIGAGLVSYLWPKNQMKDIPKVADLSLGVLDRNKKIIRASGKKYLEEFFAGIPSTKTSPGREGYVDFMSKHSEEVRTNVEEFTKRGVIDRYVELYTKCLDAAIDTSGREITKEESDNLGWRLVNYMKENTVEVYVDYSHPAVKEGFTVYGQARAKSFKKVINKNLKSLNLTEGIKFEELIRRAASREEFIQNLKEEDGARIKLYDAFAKSLRNFRDANPILQSTVLIIGPGISRNIGRKSGEYEARQTEWIYGVKK